jgi:hypothetical protein
MGSGCGDLRAVDTKKWDSVDQSIDEVLRQLRAVNPDESNSIASLELQLQRCNSTVIRSYMDSYF